MHRVVPRGEQKSIVVFVFFVFVFCIFVFFLLVFDGSLPKGRRARILVNISRVEPHRMI